jgi:hypothetical protein
MLVSVYVAIVLISMCFLCLKLIELKLAIARAIAIDEFFKCEYNLNHAYIYLQYTAALELAVDAYVHACMHIYNYYIFRARQR